MKRILALTLILAAGFLTTGSAMAQLQNAVAADIPFSFILNGRLMPAGHYIIKADSDTHEVLRIDDRDDSVHIVTMAMPAASERQADNTVLFHKYGNQYFLSSIRVSGSSMNCHLTTSKQEKWAKAQTQNAALRINDDVLIALK